MGEWRRILANPRRLVLLIALPLISVLMYVVGRMDNIQLESWGKMVEDSSFQRQIVEQYKGMDTQEALADLTQRNTMLGDVSMWTRGWALEGASKEDIIAMLTEYPSVAELIDDTTAFRTEIRKYTKVYDLMIQQMEYLQEYPVYLEKIQKQALQQSQTTVFGNHDSFSYRNLQETAKQFARMQGVEVTFGNNQAVESWIAFELADYLYVIGLIVIVLAFLEERKKGLWSTIRSCRYGRLRLGAIRVGIMLGMAIIYTVLVYGANLAIAFALDGGGCMGHCVWHRDTGDSGTISVPDAGRAGTESGLSAEFPRCDVSKELYDFDLCPAVYHVAGNSRSGHLDQRSSQNHGSSLHDQSGCARRTGTALCTGHRDLRLGITGNPCGGQ
ncbi:MAG: hypothetical protein IJ315_02625 [Firmicutes bacterium]|nr:hypothetical protein [Bacillota bacterium]